MGFYDEFMGFYGDFMGFYGDFLGFYGEFMGCSGHAGNDYLFWGSLERKMFVKAGG